MPKARRKKPPGKRQSPKAQHGRALKVAAGIKKVRPAAKPSKEEFVSMSKVEVGAGVGKPVPFNDFTRAEPAQVVEDKVSAVKKPPKWIYPMIERGATREQVLERAYERLKRSPTRSNQLLVQALIQEFGRSSRRRIRPRPLVTQARVSELIGKEG